MKTPNSDTSPNSGAVPTEERLPTPQEAAILAKVIRARMKKRMARYRRTDDIRRAASLFSLRPRLPKRDYQNHAEQILRDSWEQTGDYLRLAMMGWSMGERDDDT